MHTYRVAQRLLSIDPALPEMAARRVDDLEPSLADSNAVPRPPIAGEPVFRGDGQLGPVRRHIDCRWSQHGYSLRVDGVGHFRITSDGRQISRSDAAGELAEAAEPPEQLTETVLGPAMTLALALQGVWCLHASAVEYQGGVVALIGVSGAGKSTLGRELPTRDPNLRCASDDVLPVAFDAPHLEEHLEEGAARALPRFPQLKYRLDHQPGDNLPASLPLRRIFVLEPTHDPDAAVAVEPLAGTQAVLALVRHTVAARLFTKELLKRHMDFCVRLAERVELNALHYPHRPASLDTVRELLFPRTA